MGTVQLWLVADGGSDMTNGYSNVTKSGVNLDSPNVIYDFQKFLEIFRPCDM